MHESRYEKQRQLSIQLEKDRNELKLLESSLSKTNLFADKVTGMLTSIDQRLGKLEGLIVPIQAVTMKYTKLEERVNQMKDALENYTKLFDVYPAEEPIIKAGILHGNIDNYLDSIKRIQDTVVQLQGLKYSSGNSAILALKELQKRAYEKLDAQFMEWLSVISSHLDIDSFSSKEYPPINEKFMQKLVKLSQYLSTSMNEVGAVSNFAEIYKDAREDFITRSLKDVCKAAKDQEQGFNLKPSRYEKGTTLLVPYYQRLAWFMMNEKILITKLFSHSYASLIFGSIFAKSIDSFLESAESAHTRTKKSLSKKEFGDILLLLDICNGINESTDSDTLDFGCLGPRGNEITVYTRSIISTIIAFTKSFMGEFNSDVNKQSALAPDATIHELTSTTLNTLKRLLDYSKPFGVILAGERSGEFTNICTFSHLVSRVIDALIVDIEIKAKGYKKPVFSAIFLLNNFHYISKSIKTCELSNFVEPAVLENFSRLLAKQMDLYRKNWITCVEFLMDSTTIQDGSVVKTLSSKQRESVKERFKGFNESFDDFLKTSTTYSVPDLELRAQMVDDLKSVLIPMYDRFYDKYQGSDFSRNPDKYIKFSKDGLASLLSKLYEDNRL